jgi:Flp pilus assembly protein TadB
MPDLESLLAVLGGLTAAGWCSVGFAGLAAFWLVRPPPKLLPRADVVGAGRGAQDWAWLRGRDGAPGLARRLTLSAAAATGLCLAPSSLADGPGWWIWLGWPAVAALGAVLLGILEPLSDRRRREQLVSDTPQALELLATVLAAGIPVRLAGRVVADAFDSALGEDLRRMLALAELGMSDSEAWRTLLGHPQLGPAAQDMSRSVESGTEMVEALRRHAAAAREARRTRMVIRARSVGVRSVLPLMLCFIPSFLLLGVVPTVVSSLVAALG